MYNSNMVIQRTNQEWLNDLSAVDDRQAQSLEDLRAIILRGLPLAVEGKLAPDDPWYESLAEQVVQATLPRVYAGLAAFDGCGEFTTWVYKIVVREALLQLRRKHWQDARLAEAEAGNAADIMVLGIPVDRCSLENLLANSPFLQYLHCVLREELSANQREAIRAMVMQRMPKEDVMQQLGMERIMYFKMIHDARLRLKRRFLNDQMPDFSK
jgi:DNA-directed RNA polymerase specialized sigma24 family protein